jgi:membrane fusion protein, multidrug efflux system
VRPVTITQQDDVRAVIGKGVQVGERVVTTGFARLTDGTKVTATNAEDAGQVGADAGAPDGKRKRGGGGGGKGKSSSGGPPGQ